MVTAGSRSVWRGAGGGVDYRGEQTAIGGGDSSATAYRRQPSSISSSVQCANVFRMDIIRKTHACAWVLRKTYPCACITYLAGIISLSVDYNSILPSVWCSQAWPLPDTTVHRGVHTSVPPLAFPGVNYNDDASVPASDKNFHTFHW
jgi:hypothetical protein